MSKRKAAADAAPLAPVKRVTPLRDPSLFDEIIYIDVGPEKKRFGMHKGLLCDVSHYFIGALLGDFKEAREGVIVMEDEEPEMFDLFNAWLYTGSLVPDEGDLDLESVLPLSKLYVFANKRLIPTLQDHLIDVFLGIRFRARFRISGRFLSRSWSVFAEAPKLCELFAHWYAEYARRPILFKGKKASDYNIDFVVGVAEELAGKLRNKEGLIEENLWKKRCRWHVHDEAAQCPNDSG